MADDISDVIEDVSSDEEGEPKKRTLTCEDFNMDDVSCMKCDEDCPDARSLQCGHLFCLECITDEVKHSPSPEAIPCPICRTITTMPSGGWDKLGKEPPSTSNDLDPTTVADDVIQNGDDFPSYDIETETDENKDDEVKTEMAEDKEDDAKEEEEKDVKETKEEEVKEIKEDEANETKEEDAKETKEETKEMKKDEDAKEDSPDDDTKTEKELADVDLNDQENGKKVEVCPKHQEPLVKNRCKTCRAIENRNKKIQKLVGNKVQVCDGLFQDINHLQTAIHTGMDKLKEEIQERSRLLIAEVQKLEQQELAQLQQHREQRVEKLRECGQTLMEVAKGIRDELAVVQDKVESTQDSEFNESLKELRKSCGKKIPQPDQKLKLIAFVPGKEDKLPEVFGKIDEKPKE
ncbi:uncharacterized protein [Amphiura filiformis]|uniref:uncharacterized protein n=1 Tax=Amphiura filiformis TaxID=82378 RepID=UPI003B20F609